MKFIIETGQPDRNGDVVMLDGLQIPDKVLLIKDFEAHNPIAWGKVFKEDGVLKAEAELPNDLDGYPAIGIKIISSKPNKHGGRNITEAKLYSVGISIHPNVDESIKRIKDQ